VNKGYDIPAIQGESALQMAVSLMLRRYMESDETPRERRPSGCSRTHGSSVCLVVVGPCGRIRGCAVQMETERNKNGGTPR
jgi:hypothetical protein